LNPPFSSPDTRSETAYRGRFAPSPTGPLHLGSLYTALAGFLQARAHQGLWHLRIDDIDPPRTVRGSADRIMYALDTLGLHWDGPVLHQSRRLEEYRAALDRLRSEGLIYSCTCSRKELASLSGEAAGVYPGLCRLRTAEPRSEPHALRIVTEGAHIAFHDRLQGPIEQNLEREVGDFILFRRDQVYAYHLATVLDDAEQGITEVLRGIDLLDSTPRQIFLQETLGLPAKGYAHVPILVDSRGQKLSKQSFAPEADTGNPGNILFRLLELLNQSPPAELKTATAEEILTWAIEHWDLSRLKKLDRIEVEPARFEAPPHPDNTTS
jgi:glutamyl-Q tRNA(Asp) synthetase